MEEKLEAAKEGGIKRVIVPMTNYTDLPDKWKDDPDMEVKCALNIYELINHCLEDGEGRRPLVIEWPVLASGFSYAHNQSTPWYAGTSSTLNDFSHVPNGRAPRRPPPRGSPTCSREARMLVWW